jgi:hypothetical protein
MAVLSWNEIDVRAAVFVKEWREYAKKAREKADDQTFETDFFHIFGIDRRKKAIFQAPVRKRDGYDAPDLFGNPKKAGLGYIDCFWPGYILIEMKSPGEDLQEAYHQALGYANSLQAKDLPRGILICDFWTFHYYNLDEDGKRYEFTLEELPSYVRLFGYLAGYEDVSFRSLDPVNIEAAEKMGRLHDRLKASGYTGHQLEVYLVRLLFCLFADHTGIFPFNHFLTYIIQKTNPDGTDLALHLAKIFEVLNRPDDRRMKTIDQQLSQFPYIDGGLFEETLSIADFDAKMRDTLIECCALDWSRISPAVFGAMFQSVMSAEDRHDIGAHYTSETNILKVIKPLFLDNLRAEFENIRKLKTDIRRDRLLTFHQKLRTLTFLDPACGCGNFLIISYREIRLLELDVLAELEGKAQSLDVEHLIWVNVDQFYGIEIEEFPAQIAQTALWLTDHQMNMKVRERFGQGFNRIPLKASPSIRCTNALALDWESMVLKTELRYILGNPPFLGYSIMNKTQKKEVEQVFGGLKGCGELDYVTCWYKKAAQYIQGTAIEVAFVSTNSICQGQSVPILWRDLFSNHQIRIHFAHQTFKWSNEARGKAAVYCVIIGFGLADRKDKRIFTYQDIRGEPVVSSARQINAYLFDGETVFIDRRSSPICAVPRMASGNRPADDGNLLFSDAEKQAFLIKEPQAEPYIMPFLSASEFLNGKKRWCLWLAGVEPADLRAMPEVLKRVEAVKRFRAASVDESMRGLAVKPALFRETNRPASFILIPRVSSENRQYVPMGFFDDSFIAGDTCHTIPGAARYHFGVLESTMHMAWMRYVCGRLKSDYRYSKDIVYNNFPWPDPTDKQKAAIEQKAQAVLDVRAAFPKSSLADLYDPLSMPPELAKAHQKLDQAVEAAYGREFDSDGERVAYLFELYQKLTGELFQEEKKRGKGRKTK